MVDCRMWGREQARRKERLRPPMARVGGGKGMPRPWAWVEKPDGWGGRPKLPLRLPHAGPRAGKASGVLSRRLGPTCSRPPAAPAAPPPPPPPPPPASWPPKAPIKSTVGSHHFCAHPFPPTTRPIRGTGQLRAAHLLLPPAPISQPTSLAHPFPPRRRRCWTWEGPTPSPTSPACPSPPAAAASTWAQRAA